MDQVSISMLLWQQKKPSPPPPPPPPRPPRPPAGGFEAQGTGSRAGTAEVMEVIQGTGGAQRGPAGGGPWMELIKHSLVAKML